MLARTASSDAMLSAFVTTRRFDREASARATSVVVDPPLSPTDDVSGGTSRLVRSAIARLAS